MNTFIKKHQKKFLAIFSIGLMITFVASSGYGRGDTHRSETVIGSIGKTKIYNTELAQSKREWDLLKQYVSVKEQSQQFGDEPREVPFVYHEFGQFAQALDDKPEMFMLLRHEARTAGVRVDNDEVQTILANDVHRPMTDDDTFDDTVRDGVTSVLLIIANADRMTTDVKVSKPAVEQELARQLQKIKLDVVEFAAPRFEASVAAPTTQQVRQQFDKYANVAPGDTATPGNPFGFGYRQPNRVRLQYLSVQQADVAKAVESSLSAYDWDVKANLYYLQNPQNYPSTQAAAAATRPALGPAVQPFAQVRDQVLRDVRQPMIDKLALDVQNRLSSGMQSLWANGSSSTTRPAAADLQKLADGVTADLKVPVHVTDLSADELSAVQLAALPGIGAANNGRSMFATDAMAVAKAYLLDPTKPDALHQLTKPSQPLLDVSQNAYLYRLVGADAAAPAPDLASVQSRINADLRLAAGYEQAKTAAEAMLTVAGKIGLRPASVAADGVAVVTTDSFGGTNAGENLNVPLSDAARGDFVRQGFGLLNKYDRTKSPNPLGLIEVPQDGRVFVARLAEVTRPADVPVYMKQLQVEAELRVRLLQPFFTQWFNSDAIAHRTGWTPVAKNDAA